jgi:2-methylcitrate dehydratase PrpD
MDQTSLIFGTFAVEAVPPAAAVAVAAGALVDTVGVTLAGADEPAARIVRSVIGEAGGPCQIHGTNVRASAGAAALANGTAAHALDYDDMCFVSIAHPSAPLIPTVLAAGEIAGATGHAVLAAYVVGFEIETRLGRAMNPRHYERGWHCTATLGTIGAAAGAARLLGLDAAATAHAIGIAASMASGLKENFGSMVKPLHAGLAAQNGVLSALLARGGLTSSPHAIDGAQGFLAAMDSAHLSIDTEARDLGHHWEIVETGITVKLYPSCAGTHPTLDAILDLRRELSFAAADVAAVDVDVDRITPGILIHDRPSSGLEAKFSMPFCVAAAIVFGRVGIDTFEPEAIADARVQALLPRIQMRVDGRLDEGGAPLTRARVHLTLENGDVHTREANGARGYPTRPASRTDLDEKFLSCAARVLSAAQSRRALDAARRVEQMPDIRELTDALMSTGSHSDDVQNPST